MFAPLTSPMDIAASIEDGPVSPPLLGVGVFAGNVESAASVITGH
jgi:hypothetical protein